MARKNNGNMLVEFIFVVTLFPIILMALVGLIEVQQLKLRMISAARLGGLLVSRPQINESQAKLAIGEYLSETSKCERFINKISVNRYTKIPSALFFELYEVQIKAQIKKIPLQESFLIEEDHQSEIKL